MTACGWRADSPNGDNGDRQENLAASGPAARSDHRMGAAQAAQRQRRSVLSFALASATVCHCMFEGRSAPPHSRATLWSTT